MSAANVTSSPNPPPQSCDVDSVTTKVFKTVAWSSMLLLALVGNALIVGTIYRGRNMRTNVNLFILNMSISDLIIPIFITPNRIKQIFLPRNQWIIDGFLGVFFCKFSLFAENTSVIVSIIGLLTITVERFYGVVYPLKTQPIRTKKTCYVLIGVSWIVGVIWCSQFLYTQRLIHREGKPYCIYSWEPISDTAKTSNILHSTFLVCFTVVPFIALISLYIPIIVALQRRNSNRLQLASEQRRRRIKQSRQVSLMLAIVVGFFLLSWMPANIYIFLRVFVLDERRPCRLRHFIFAANFLSYTYPSVNPIIYYLFSEKYRRGFQELLSCLTRLKSFSFRKEQVTLQRDVNSTDTRPEARKSVFLLQMRPLNVH